MTILFLVLFSTSFIVKAADKVSPCTPLSLVDSIIKELMTDVENLSRHKAKKLATELILRQCQAEKDKGTEGVRIRDGKVKFSEYSNSWDTNDPVFFCKNNAGYKSYLSHMTHRLLQTGNKKEELERNYKRKPSSGNSSRTVRKVEPVKEAMWICLIPSYFKVPKRVNKNQKITLTNTYPNIVCSPAS